MKKLIVLLLLLASCSQDKYVSDHSLLPYVKEFEYQASIRGIKIKWDGLKIKTGTDFENGSFGYYNPNDHTIYIDNQSQLWNINLEELMMHELGHAILGRGHDFSYMNDNIWLKKSVMGFMAEPFFSTVDSLSYRKEYYYNELFNNNTPEPDWVY